MSNFTIDPSETGAEIKLSGSALAHYVSTSDVPAIDTPKPYVHPLRTRAGTTITGFAPDDHPWHHGLQFAFPRVGGHNLWGGGTYLGPDGGYQVGDDHGRILHETWQEMSTSGNSATLEQSLRWVGREGEELIREERQLRFSDGADAHDAVVLDFVTSLHNASGSPLELATPAQRGRPDGGYGGLFLRLSDGFTASALTGVDGPITASGGASRTLVIEASTGSGTPVTLGLSFLPGGSPGAEKWLYRFEDFAAVGWAVAYDDALTLEVDQPLAFAHRLVIFDGHVDAETVAALL